MTCKESSRYRRLLLRCPATWILAAGHMYSAAGHADRLRVEIDVEIPDRNDGLRTSPGAAQQILASRYSFVGVYHRSIVLRPSLYVFGCVSQRGNAITQT